MPFQVFVTAANKAQSAQELVNVWQEVMAAIGFDRLLFSLLNDHDAIGRRAGHIVAVNFPKEWLARYFAIGFEPLRQHMFVTNGAFTWADFAKSKRLSTIQFSVFAQGRATGLHDGIGIPLRGPLGAFAGVTASASVEKGINLADVLGCAEMISNRFYIRFLQLEQRPGGDEEIRLTEQERQVLTWYALGKSQPEIAIILGVSPHVVKFHLKGVFKKLDVHNDRVAVLKATALGLIAP
jgi:DNA-binding CsgD family transcriptional regulator